MLSLEHRIRVFVFQVLPEQVQFLLLRHKPTSEWPLGPVVGSLDPAEQLRDSAIRGVAEETGITHPVEVLELSQPEKHLFGDLGYIEWPMAYQAGTPDRPAADLQPGPKVGEIGWMGFQDAFREVEHPADREALVRLQLLVHGGE